MANSNKVFVSPGVYTSEKDLTFVAQSVGVTTLGLAGETLKGPAFEPILITNFDEFRTYFGSTSPLKDGRGDPKYELPYVAKSYLQESNQLFVTRVLGLTGYKPYISFGIKTIGGITVDTSETPSSLTGGTFEPTLSGMTSSTYYSLLSGKTATTGESVPEYIVDNFPYSNSINESYYNGDWFKIGLVPTGDTQSLTGTQKTSPIGEYSNSNWYNYFYENSGDLYSYLFVYNSGTSVFDVTQYTYTGAIVNEYNDLTVAMMRSRGNYSGQTLNLEVTGNTQFTITSSEIETNPLGLFTINIVSGLTSGTKTFTCSLDTSSPSYITKVLGVDVFDKNKQQYPVYVKEVYPELIKDLFAQGKIRGLSTDVVYHLTGDDFMTKWDSPKSPMVVSEVRGGSVDDLFEIISISDGDSANQQIKVTIMNIDLDKLEFDLLVRDYNDTDDNMVVLERFSRCTMDINLPGYIARKIGTFDTEYELRSKYIMLTMVEDHPTDAVPAGFKGFVTDYLNDESVLGGIQYKTKYYSAGDETGEYSSTGEPLTRSTPDRPRRVSLGLSSEIGFDSSMFTFKGSDAGKSTPGFHLSVNATSIINTGTTTGYMFDCTPYDLEGQTGFDVTENPLKSINYRKFTLGVTGGFDGWDIYRDVRTNTDGYIFSNKIYTSGNTDNGGVFSTTVGNSDYYAYLAAIETYNNPEAIDINIFATPGINFRDHNSLVTETIDMIENDRADSFYIINAPNVGTVDEVTDEIDLANIDSNYSATYWPWIQIRDNTNSTQLYIPPTAEIVKNVALTDNVAYPWYSVAGYSRGLVSAIKARIKLTLDMRDLLYKNRVNPIATFSDTGTIIWGNKTLQVKESALDRINVRRLLLRARKLISAVSVRLIFEQNDEKVRDEFLRLTNPILEAIKKERGLYDFRVTVSNDPEDIDTNTLRGKIYIKPTRSLEYIDLEFIITPTGASFEDV